MEMPVIIKKEGKWYTAWAVDVDIVTQGKTIEEAIKNIKEAVELYLEDEDTGIKTDELIIYPLKVDAHAKASSPTC